MAASDRRETGADGKIPRFDRGENISFLFVPSPAAEWRITMDKHELTEILNQVADGSLSPDDAALRLKMQPFQEIGNYAKVDFHRGIRQGVPEVIYGAGKAKEHILGIAKAMMNNGQKTILITRLSEEAAEYVKSAAKQEILIFTKFNLLLETSPKEPFWYRTKFWLKSRKEKN